MIERRIFISRMGGLFGLGATLSAMPLQPAAGAISDATAMAAAERMRLLALQQGDRGYGAVVVREGRIVAEAPSRVVTRGDPTAHAETEAIRDAARSLGTTDLSGCLLYSTSRACPMCEAAAYWGNIDGMRFGADIADAGAPQLHRC